MELGLKGKKALVFGASSGIGRAIAETLYSESISLAASSRGGAKLESLRKNRPDLQLVTADFEKTGEARSATAKAIQLLNGLDILIINTGGPPMGSFDSITTEKWMIGFQSLWLSTTEAIQEALPTMQKQGFGRIILIASTSAKEPIPNLTVSNGIRAGLLGMIKSLSNEIAPFGITANVIMPGFIETERLAELGIQEANILKLIPANRLGRPEEIAQLVTFLSSTAASYITGQAIACDGGRLKSF